MAIGSKFLRPIRLGTLNAMGKHMRYDSKHFPHATTPQPTPGGNAYGLGIEPRQQLGLLLAVAALQFFQLLSARVQGGKRQFGQGRIDVAH